MRQPCELASHYVLPSLRFLLAKELIETYGLSQIEAAKKLGTTPAAISQYLSNKRGNKWLKEIAALANVKSAVTKTAFEIAGSKIDDADASRILCKLCTNLFEHDAFSKHETSVNFSAKCHICHK